MKRTIKKRSAKAGLPPGTPVHIGDARAAKTRIEIIHYGEGGYSQKSYDSIHECPLVKNAPGITWINVDGVHDVSVLEKLGGCFGLHPLVLEDIANTDQRPKFEDYGDYVYIVAKMLYSTPGNGDDVTAEQVSIILGPNYVLSFQEQERKGDVFGPVRERIKSSKGKICEMGADYLAYSLIDAVVDNYFLILEGLGEKIEVLEDELVARPEPDTLHKIHRLKGDMIYLRRSVWPLREVVNAFERADTALVSEHTKIYLRDVYDHAIQVIDTVETYRDLLAGMLDIYLSSVSYRLNEVMKVLTIISTIFIPLTFLAGVYGMNFSFLPELGWHYGYLGFWIICVMTVIGMFFFFKRKKWL
jgi:magnesium transporter